MIYDISSEGVAELRNLGKTLENAVSDIKEQTERLGKCVEGKRDDVGIYYDFLLDHIRNMSECMQLYTSDINAVAQGLYDKADQVDDIVSDINRDRYSAYMNHEVRRIVNNSSATKTVRNKEVNGAGEAKGHYDGDVFYFSNTYVPKNQFNADGRNIGEIREYLRNVYGIELSGIPIIDGEADFSSIAVASVTYSQIMKKATGKSIEEVEQEIDKCRIEHEEKTADKKCEDPVGMRLSVLQETFGKNDKGNAPRSRNFEIADSIVADMQMDIPGLEQPYVKADVEKWRKKNHFSWDEQLDNGYILVPSIIHAEIQHRGLVGYASSAVSEYEKEKQFVEMHDSELYWNEEDAPVTISDLERKEKK